MGSIAGEPCGSARCGLSVHARTGPVGSVVSASTGGHWARGAGTVGRWAAVVGVICRRSTRVWLICGRAACVWLVGGWPTVVGVICRRAARSWAIGRRTTWVRVISRRPIVGSLHPTTAGVACRPCGRLRRSGCRRRSGPGWRRSLLVGVSACQAAYTQESGNNQNC
jgi:hypothetical protein